MFHRKPSRVSRGPRAAVDFVMCFGCGGFFLFFSPIFFFEGTQLAASMRPPCPIYLSTGIEAVFFYKAKKLRIGVRTGLIRLLVCVCATFVAFTDCESCTRPISTHPGPIATEAGEYGLTCGTCFITRRLDVVPIAGLLWISWCVLGAAGFR